jgi:hypothetical protein
MVVMSMEAWEEMNFENEIYQKLTEAQAEARSNPRRLSHDEVFGPLRQKIAGYGKIYQGLKNVSACSSIISSY